MDSNKTSLLLSLPPHLRLPSGTGSVTGDLLIALAPALILSVIHYGVRALVLLAVCAAASAALTALAVLILHRGRSGDVLYAAACGLLCALFFGAGSPVWLSALCGALCAIIVCIGVYTGRRTLFHPALCAYLIALALFPAQTTAYTVQLDGFRGFFSMAARTAAASPTAQLAAGEKLAPLSLLLGEGAGMLGATDPVALLIGFGYLLLRHIANLRAPLCALAALFVCALFFPVGASPLAYAFALTLSGGFLTGLAFFLFPLNLAPMSRRGQMIYGLGYGLGCFLLRRVFGADGAACALVFMQTFVFRLDCLQSAPALRASRLGARLEALLLRSAHTRRDTAYRMQARRAPQPASEPEQPAIPAEAPAEEIAEEIAEEAPEEAASEIPEYAQEISEELVEDLVSDILEYAQEIPEEIPDAPDLYIEETIEETEEADEIPEQEADDDGRE